MHAFRTFGDAEPTIDQDGRYDLLYAYWAGTWRDTDWVRAQHASDDRLYRATRQLWRQADAVVSLYEQFVYAGDLSTDGKPLPDGTGGAIPIDPQAGNDAENDALRRACSELWNMWNYRQQMSQRPKMGAILGDCLTELVDDPSRGVVLPRMIWPGYVVDLELDLVGNVKRYAIEYLVDTPASSRYGQHIPQERYRFRKEVDRTALRYFRDDKPDPRYGEGTGAEENPYGFVPAIWDRHEIVWGDRGMSAIERTMQQTMELNSVLSHALDYQRKQFAAPVGVVGAAVPRRGNQGDAAANDPEFRAKLASESIPLLPMQDNGKFVTVTMDIGQTTEMLQLVMDSVLAENPEARYGQEILQMTQVTAPGIERALGTIGGRLNRARSNYDPQTVKLHQMAIAMIGWRLASDGYLDEIVRARQARYDAFRPFDLDSYGQGALDFSIPDRPWIPETIDERVARLVMIESLQTEYALLRAGVEPDEVASILGERKAAQDAREVAIERRFNAGLNGALEGDAADEAEEDAA